MAPAFGTFTDWADLLRAIQQGASIYYQAPLDHRPVLVRVRIMRYSKRVRVDPPSRDVDPFMADNAHLSRFRYRLPEV